MRGGRYVLVHANQHALVRRTIPLCERLARQVGRAEEHRGRLAFVFEGPEVVPDILHNRSAERATNLLVLVRKTTSRHAVRRAERSVTKVAVHGARSHVRARFRNGLHLSPSRSSLADVEHASDHLEFSNSLATELWLTHNRERAVVGHLLTVEVQLKCGIARYARSTRRVIRRNALDLQRQLHPVATSQRQVLHLAPIDVSCNGRRCRIEERRIVRDSQLVAQSTNPQRERRYA